jgi:uncharacterized protein (DUF1697 family)
MKYIALLRGIGPGNPNMTNDKLRGVFEALGFMDVQSVISSGNIIFTAPKEDSSSLEKIIQTGLQEILGIPGGTVIRSEEEIKAFVATYPFGDREHGPASYLTVTFMKDRSFTFPLDLPYKSERGYVLEGYDKAIDAVCAVVDTTSGKTVDYMTWMEKQCGKDITTRTWKTIERIAKKF